MSGLLAVEKTSGEVMGGVTAEARWGELEHWTLGLGRG
jgi:hypothetical protein